jgi:Ca2+-binding RTX toxin-like protein
MTTAGLAKQSCSQPNGEAAMPSTPSAEEQLLLELINRLRADPEAEAGLLTGVNADPDVQSAINFFGVSVSAFVAQMAAFDAVAPLAWNGNLADAADGHNQAMIDADMQTHQAPGEPNLGQRATNAGYANWNTLGENVYAFSEDVLYGHAGFVIDWGYDAEDINGNQLFPDWQTRGDGMQDPPGHRNSLMNGNFAEIGISVVAETNPATQVGPQLITQNLGNRFDYQAQFVGVVIDDADGDEFYDIGEGLGGVSILLQRQGGGSYNTTSWSSGGWQIAVPVGTYTITFTGGGLTAPIVLNAVLGTVNVKVDAIASESGGSTTPTQGPDTLTGTAGADAINGLGGNDSIFGLGADDVLRGAAGDDALDGGAGDDVLNGGTGADEMHGDLGDDTYFVDEAGDVVIELAGEGSDQVKSRIDYELPDHVEILTLLGAAHAGTGNGLANTIIGGSGHDTLRGLGGNDILRGAAGRDILLGGNGDDLLDGGAGKDTMTGGAGRDSFQFRDGDFGTSRSLADVIADFDQTAGEKIRLNLVDADTTTGGNQAFAWIGSGAFTDVAGQLRYAHAGGNTYVEGDLDGDGTADIFINLTGTITLTAADFVL